MFNWFMDKTEIINKTVNAVMGELECLIDHPTDSVTANYWIDSTHNVFAFINDNGDDDKWIEIHYELYDCNEDMIGDLLVVETDYTDREELLNAVKKIVNVYYGD